MIKNIVFSVLLFGLLMIFLILVVEPSINDTKFKTVTKVSEIYDEPIFFTFNWITNDELQVGKLVTLSIDVQGLPHNENATKNIEIKFDEKQINYWEDEGSWNSFNFKELQRQKEFPEKDLVQLEPNSDYSVFSSEIFNLRFISPQDISIQYCDYNLESSCHQIENIIHPAPYDIDSQIQSNRIVITMAIITASFSLIVVWLRKK